MLLGCGGPTLSRGRRLVSWLGHLCVKLLHAHNGGQAQALKPLHDDGLPFMDALEHEVKHLRSENKICWTCRKRS